MDDHCVIDDHVMGQCPEGVNTGSHSDNLAINTPAAVFTPAKEIINEGLCDTSSTISRVHKLWTLDNVYRYIYMLIHKYVSLHTGWLLRLMQISHIN